MALGNYRTHSYSFAMLILITMEALVIILQLENRSTHYRHKITDKYVFLFLLTLKETDTYIDTTEFTCNIFAGGITIIRKKW